MAQDMSYAINRFVEAASNLGFELAEGDVLARVEEIKQLFLEVEKLVLADKRLLARHARILREQAAAERADATRVRLYMTEEQAETLRKERAEERFIPLLDPTPGRITAGRNS